MSTINISCRISCTWDGKDGCTSMRHWISFITKGTKEWNPTVRWVGRAFYYYLVLITLFFIYLVLNQHNPAPFIYNNF
ncbi:teichoic acid D-Ala incorporation-associated protein DltX [Desulfitobacterium sp.]|uniref:teichoic acid D-Ala incorporation-associated protein DltX n=1 Tax=Desulfitobacterium sp. TaxID=49981 RepID=UPI003A521867